MTDLDRLDALAAAATPGPWEARYGMDATVHRTDGSYMIVGDAIYHENYKADAAFIAACDPATIRDLVAAARRGEEALTRLASWDEMAGNGDPNEFPTLYRQEIAARINLARAALHSKESAS